MQKLPLVALLFCLTLLAGCPKPPNADAAAAAASSAQAAATVPLDGKPVDPAAAASAGVPFDSAILTDTLAKAGRPNPDTGALDVDTFPFPVEGSAKTPDGYPIYAIECDRATNQCVGPTGHPIGSIEDVAKTITPIRNTDVLNPRFTCFQICYDAMQNLVGAVSPEMQAYLTAQKTAPKVAEGR